MLKLYLSYFFYGVYIFYVTLVYWGFSAGPSNILPYITLFSSMILFSVASGLVLFYPKTASILGLICLTGTTIFGAYLVGQISLSSVILSSIILLMTVLYLMGVFYSIRTVVKFRKPVEQSTLNKPIKFVLAFIPVAMLAWWVISVFIMR